VPAFRKPKGRNAAATLLMLGLIGGAMALSVVALGNLADVRMSEDPESLRGPDGRPLDPDYFQAPLIGQLADSVFSNFAVGFFVVLAATAVILLVAANTAFTGFPVLGSMLARDGYLPRQLHTRGDRLAFSNGIVLLAVFAIVLIWAFDAQVTRLIQLYIVGVFVAFTVSQTGMVRHWTRELATERDPARRRQMHRSRAINAVGMAVTGVVLVVVLVTKFTHGAWITVLAMAGWFVLMKAIHRHYGRVSEELAAGDLDQALPSRIHAIVLVSKLHKPTMRALAYARASRANLLEAVTVDVDPEVTESLMEEWDRRQINVPLKVLASPYREVTRPIVDYVRGIRRASPRDVVTVYIPEYVVGHWWEQLLHNQSALRLKGRLLFTPGVMVTSVPYQLASSEAAAARADRAAVDARAVRTGVRNPLPREHFRNRPGRSDDDGT
jgi:Amino acid permease